MTRAAWAALAMLTGALMLAAVVQEVTVLVHSDRTREAEEHIAALKRGYGSVDRLRKLGGL